MFHKLKNQLQGLFQVHIGSCQKKLQRFLVENNYPGVVIDSGSAYLYFSDDQYAPFRSNPYFKYFCPLDGEKHLLYFSVEKGFELFVYEPESFWSDIKYKAEESYWAQSFNLSYMRSAEERKKVLKSKKDWVYIGSPDQNPQEFVVQNPKSFLSALNWWRSQKSDYEILCLDEANKRGAEAHKRVKELFLSENPSEFHLHMEYLKILQEPEENLPYHSIIGHDEKAAILHYQHKRAHSKGRVLLIDSGASFASYGSDITRTYVQAKQELALFSQIVSAVDELQQDLSLGVKEGVGFLDLQIDMHHKLASLLLEHKILKSCSAEAAFKEGLTQVFCPHGLGHMLGLQVHDVGGFQADEAGTECKKDPRMPHARMNRSFRLNEVVTIEPGLYFIPSLLEDKKASDKSQHFNWKLIEGLTPLGGVRIEDNIVVKKESSLNLTRKYL